jgi:hypothetical protein
LPEISIFSHIDDDGWKRCVPFAPGIPELYDIYSKNMFDNEDRSFGNAFYSLWEISHRMVKDLQTEHKYDNLNHFLRETMQRATRPGGNTPTTAESSLTNQLHSGVQSDENSKGQLVPVHVEVGMQTVENMEQGKENENTTTAHKVNENDTEHEMETEPFMESGPETEPEIAQDNQIGEGHTDGVCRECGGVSDGYAQGSEDSIEGENETQGNEANDHENEETNRGEK